jgi:predicted ATPase
VAGGQSDRYSDGVWWVDLAAVSDSPMVAETIAEAVGAPVGGGHVHFLRTHLAAVLSSSGPAPDEPETTRILARLATWRALLCLDNAEQYYGNDRLRWATCSPAASAAAPIK